MNIGEFIQRIRDQISSWSDSSNALPASIKAPRSTKHDPLEEKVQREMRGWRHASDGSPVVDGDDRDRSTAWEK